MKNRSDLVIPSRLRSRIEESYELASSVMGCFGALEPWIADNKLTFFPDYTDHGPEHINAVMMSAVSLIGDDAWEHVTAMDCAVLAVSILLHDSALHLSEDGFVSLIRSSESPPGEFGDRPWNQTWREFLHEATRWDTDTLLGVFGEPRPVVRPSADPQVWTKRDRLLIGEFVRRHHARLAQEFARHGVPGPGGCSSLATHLDQRVAFLCGHAARSHNLDLRAAVDMLPREHRNARYGCHLPFVMAVLRIADYLQLTSERAPSQLLSVKSIRSPVSRLEWAKHHAIREIKTSPDDPEAIWIDSHPKSIHLFFALQRLLKGLQQELDRAWAVLGEVYGRTSPGLGLTLRRVRTNLDDASRFLAQEEVDYLPSEFRLRASSAELLGLLIGPLYSGRAEFGVRELLQNAVDACRERASLEDQGHIPSRGRGNTTEPTTDVLLSLDDAEDGSTWLTVSDNGVGMSTNTLRSYFLRAGASFRSSPEWRSLHLDEDQSSSVLRSGRFGIGVLAGFLLGDEIHVCTRHYDSRSALQFKVGLSDKLIKVQPGDRDVGTTIRIRLRDKGVVEQLDGADQSGRAWDWYCLKSPRVLRLRNGRRLPRRFSLPTELEAERQGWRQLRGEEDACVLWKVSGDPPLACNGIAVVRDLRQQRLHAENVNPIAVAQDPIGMFIRGLELSTPAICVFDRSGRTPLNLLRTGVDVGRLFFWDELIEQAAMDYIGWTWAKCPDTRDLKWNLRYPGDKSFEYVCSAVSGPTGWLPRHRSVLHSCGVRTFFVATTEAASKICRRVLPSAWIATDRHVKRWSRSVVEGYVRKSRPMIQEYGWSGGYVAARGSVTESSMPHPPEGVKRRAVRRGGHDLTEYLFGSNEPPPEASVAIHAFADSRHEIAVLWRDAGDIDTDTCSDSLSRTWRAVLGQEAVPYVKLEERREWLRARAPSLLPFFEHHAARS